MSSKWVVDSEAYPFEYYPPYFHGPAYILRFSLLQDLYKISEYFQFIGPDDAQIAGIFPKYLNLTLENDGRFIFYQDFPSPCGFRTDGLNSIMAGHAEYKHTSEVTYAMSVRDFWALVGSVDIKDNCCEYKSQRLNRAVRKCWSV